MGADNWIVNNRAGEEWGLIKRLILDSVTRQINYVDLVLIHTGHVARLSWDNFEIGSGGITLSLSEAQVAANDVTTSDVAGGGVLMDVWP